MKKSKARFMNNNHHRHVHIVLRIHTKLPSCRFHVFNHTQRVARNYTQRVARLNGFLSQLFDRAILLAHVRSPGMYQHAVAHPPQCFITHRPCLITSHPPPSSKSEAGIDINNVMPTAPQADPPPPAAAGGAAPAASTTTTNVSSSTQQPLASTLPPLPPVGGAGAEGTELDQTLASHYVGTFRMRLNQMSLASLARSINQNGRRVVMESIRKEGYSLATRKPSVLVPRVVIEGQELTPEFVGILNVRVLDGNHRISCLMELHDPYFAIDVLVYHDFEDSQTESVVASGR